MLYVLTSGSKLSTNSMLYYLLNHNMRDKRVVCSAGSADRAHAAEAAEVASSAADAADATEAAEAATATDNAAETTTSSATTTATAAENYKYEYRHKVLTKLYYHTLPY